MSDKDWEGSALRFGVLGPLQATYAGVGLSLGGRQQRAVLAQLVLEVGQAVPVERLVDGLWRDTVPPGAVTTVQTYVFHLRQLLEPERARGAPGRTLVTVPGGYLIDVDRRCVDLARFEDGVAAGDAAAEARDPDRAEAAYSEALSLWRGDVLADLSDYDFAAPYRARLDELRASAQQSRIQAELDLGHQAAVLAELRVLLSQNPLREGLHAQRILALYRSGRQSDALAAYRELRSVLDTELGIEPSPPLQELNTRVLRQDATLDWIPPARPAFVSLSTTSPESIVSHAPPKDPDLREGRRRRLPALAVVTAIVAVLAGGAGLPPIGTPVASAAVLANSVVELDASGKVVGSVPVGSRPTAVAASPGAIWVVNAGVDAVSRINPTTHAVEQTIDVGREPSALAVTGDDLWVTNFSSDTVTRINVLANRGKVVDEIDVGSGPDAIAAGPAGLWVANSGDNTIQRIDTKSGTPDVAIKVDDGPDGLAVDNTSVWVANGRSGTVMRIDAQSGEPMALPIQVGSGPRGIIRVGDDVWVADELSQSVTRINVATGLAHTLDVGDGPTAIAALGPSVWVAEKYSGDLLRIDLATEKKERIDIRDPVRGLAVVDGRIWISSGAFPSAQHSGGTLRVAAAFLPGGYNGVDPARVYDRTTFHAERFVYDGLLALNYSGADAQVLVPDLATSVPEPTDDGKTYTFNLRPGIRYSTGDEVMATDLVRGVQRALHPRGARHDFFAGIVGGQACIQHFASCDLSDGVVPDDASGRVTFHLVAPDPQFLYKVALFVVPTPPETPFGRIESPIPGTGPYRIASYSYGAAFALERNEFYRQWSAAAQPAAFLDAITWVRVADARKAAEAVQQGRADLAELTPLFSHGVGGPLVDELSVTATSRVHPSDTQGTAFAVLNSSVPPFNNIFARRAFNYAVDRGKAVELLGGPLVADATCQLVPPTLPSYQPYCPYTTGSSGGHEEPNLARARELVRRSGTGGMVVKVADIVGDYNTPLDGYFAHVLRRIGYDASVDLLPENVRNEDRFYSPHSHFQVESGGFYADYPLPSNFYELVSCHPPAGSYPFRYCNRALDNRAAAANAKLQTHPGAALRAWTRIERDLTGKAPLVPVSNDVNWWLTSKRVGNYQRGSGNVIGPLLSQLWVQ